MKRENFLEKTKEELKKALELIEHSKDSEDEKLSYLSCKLGILKEDIEKYKKTSKKNIK